jgi:histidinol-phosphatase (PHP family)
MIDCHTHTKPFSPDGRSTVAEMISAADKRGLDMITFTDHVEFFPDNSKCNLPCYEDLAKEIADFNNVHHPHVKVIIGAELSLNLDYKKQLEKAASDKHVEFVIGSVHDIDGAEIHTGEFFIGKTKQQAYSQMIQSTMKYIKTIKGIDIVGHFDYITRYSPYEDKFLNYADFSDEVDEFLKTAIELNIGLEINAAGWRERYGLNRPHPNIDVLTRYRELGGEVITYGSDAHIVSLIAAHYDDSIEILRKAGFRYIAFFRNRKPQFIKI